MIYIKKNIDLGNWIESNIYNLLIIQVRFDC